MLSEDDRHRVEHAIRAAERRTAGEIVVVVARQAASYRSVPLAWALGLALVAPWLLLATTRLSLGALLVAPALAAALVLALLSRPAWRLVVTPRPVRRARAREAAQREFVARGLAQTRGRTGVLLYVAAAERHAEVIGDVAIGAAVAPEAWQDVVEAVVAGIAAGRAADGLCAGIERIGAILAEHVPPGSADTDELPNRVVLL